MTNPANTKPISFAAKQRRDPESQEIVEFLKTGTLSADK